MPVYCFDTRFSNHQVQFEATKCGVHRTQFILESLHDLRKSLREIGSDLYVFCGLTEQILTSFVDSETTVVYSSHVCSEERQIEDKVA